LRYSAKLSRLAAEGAPAHLLRNRRGLKRSRFGPCSRPLSTSTDSAFKAAHHQRWKEELV
jgi:hypothetical protein